ncbi:MAG: response regulator [Bacteroidota bacterium]|jgi:NarL family two-component system response regulator LiaR
MTTNEEKIKILIVDDHQVVRQGLRTFLELNKDILVLGEAADGQEAVEMTDRLRPDIVLMDLVMPRLDGIAATSQIKSLGGATKVIVLTNFTEDDKVFPAIQAGACSYLLKDVSPDALIDAIRAAHHGEARLHPEVMRKLMNQITTQSSSNKEGNAPQLTDREREVIHLVVQGRSNREIADVLMISEKTAKAHISNILGKLGVEDRTQMAVYAIKYGLANP